jgi:DNA-binding NarL/FixJ family response regulator
VPPQSLPLRVLIVDDSLLLRERLSCRLAKIDGVEIAGKAGDVAGGIASFRALTPDVVVLDVQMPGGTGIDVLEVIKRERPATTVMILTNYPLPQFRKRSADAGAEYFFDKTAESGKVGDVLKGLVRDRTGTGTPAP